jgi:hypothetical protein
MAAQFGFQTNTTIHAAFWWYKPDPGDPTGREIMVEVNGLIQIESTSDHNKVWLYYPATTGSTNLESIILTGPVAQAFMNSMENLFS